MKLEGMFLMDTEHSGRYFDARSFKVQMFHNVKEFKRLCQFTQYDAINMENAEPIPHYPARGNLVSLRISIFAVDQNGAHGILHISSSKHVIFKSSDELEQLIRKEADHARVEQLRRAHNRFGVSFRKDTKKMIPYEVQYSQG